MKTLILILIISLSISNATSTHRQFINDKERKNVVKKAKRFISQKYFFKKPRKSYKLSIRAIKSQNNFVRLESVAVYNNGNYVENDYVEDIVFNLCLAKVNNRWHIVFDLSRNDVPSSEEMRKIKSDFPSNFPLKLLSPFWQKLFK
ncbi:MAG: hypothetical protein QM493_00260 [Sulfurovum sp.]